VIRADRRRVAGADTAFQNTHASSALPTNDGAAGTGAEVGRAHAGLLGQRLADGRLHAFVQRRFIEHIDRLDDLSAAAAGACRGDDDLLAVHARAETQLQLQFA